MIIGEPNARDRRDDVGVLGAHRRRDLSLRRRAARPSGHAIADAGDTDRDGVDDIISGACGPVGAGRAYLYSGRTGRLLHSGRAAAGRPIGRAVVERGRREPRRLRRRRVGAPSATGRRVRVLRSHRSAAAPHRRPRTVAGRADWTPSLDHGRSTCSSAPSRNAAAAASTCIAASASASRSPHPRARGLRPVLRRRRRARRRRPRPGPLRGRLRRERWQRLGRRLLGP